MQIIFQIICIIKTAAMNVFQLLVRHELMDLMKETKRNILDLLKKVGLKEEHLYRYAERI